MQIEIKNKVMADIHTMQCNNLSFLIMSMKRFRCIDNAVGEVILSYINNNINKIVPNNLAVSLKIISELPFLRKSYQEKLNWREIEKYLKQSLIKDNNMVFI